MALAHNGAKSYRQAFDLLHRHQAERSNAVWEADHTLFDLWIASPAGPARPWLTVDDHSRAVAGYSSSLSRRSESLYMRRAMTVPVPTMRLGLVVSRR